MMTKPDMAEDQGEACCGPADGLDGMLGDVVRCPPKVKGTRDSYANSPISRWDGETLTDMCQIAGSWQARSRRTACGWAAAGAARRGSKPGDKNCSGILPRRLGRRRPKRYPGGASYSVNSSQKQKPSGVYEGFWVDGWRLRWNIEA
jgi:hypothetical protein